MPIKMVTTDRHYDKVEGYEYPKGAGITVETEAEADRLERRKKAKRVTEPAKPPAPAPRNKAMRSDSGSPGRSQPVTPATTDDHSAIVQPATHSERYRRSDMRSED